MKYKVKGTYLVKRPYEAIIEIEDSEMKTDVLTIYGSSLNMYAKELIANEEALKVTAEDEVCDWTRLNDGVTLEKFEDTNSTNEISW